MFHLLSAEKRSYHLFIYFFHILKRHAFKYHIRVWDRQMSQITLQARYEFLDVHDI